MLRWPYGSTMYAASSGPVAEPALPPTWNSDCAKPCRPPDASRATRDDSGWNTDEPMPTIATAKRITPYVGATESSSRPTSVKAMPVGKRIRPRASVGEVADDRLQQRRRRLVGERDEADLAEVQAIGRLQDRIHSRQHRLHQIVQAVTDADRGEDAERSSVRRGS